MLVIAASSTELAPRRSQEPPQHERRPWAHCLPGDPGQQRRARRHPEAFAAAVEKAHGQNSGPCRESFRPYSILPRATPAMSSKESSLSTSPMIGQYFFLNLGNAPLAGLRRSRPPSANHASTSAGVSSSPGPALTSRLIQRAKPGEKKPYTPAVSSRRPRLANETTSSVARLWIRERFSRLAMVFLEGFDWLMARIVSSGIFSLSELCDQ